MKIPKPLKITSRISTITNSFAQAIIPTEVPTEDEVNELLVRLEMSFDDRKCVYCGDSATDWDHLRSLVSNKEPSGYVTESRNLVPSCGTCNQSKGGSDWKKWMTGPAKKSPKSRKISNLDRKIAILEAFVQWGGVKPVNFDEHANKDDWEAYWNARLSIEKQMREAQLLAEKIRNSIQKNLKHRHVGNGFPQKLTIGEK